MSDSEARVRELAEMLIDSCGVPAEVLKEMGSLARDMRGRDFDFLIDEVNKELGN